MKSIALRWHVRLFLKSWGSSVLAIMVAWEANSFLFDPSSAKTEWLFNPIALLLTILLLLLIAGIFIFPAIAVGHVMAILVARLVRSPARAALVGSALGPVIGLPMTALVYRIPSETFWSAFDRDVLGAVPMAIAGGATIGWVVARDYARLRLKPRAPGTAGG